MSCRSQWCVKEDLKKNSGVHSLSVSWLFNFGHGTWYSISQITVRGWLCAYSSNARCLEIYTERSISKEILQPRKGHRQYFIEGREVAQSPTLCFSPVCLPFCCTSLLLTLGWPQLQATASTGCRSNLKRNDLVSTPNWQTEMHTPTGTMWANLCSDRHRKLISQCGEW